MDLKLFDKKHLYNVKNYKKHGDSIITRCYIDALSLPVEDLVFMLENCEGTYSISVSKKDDKILQQQFVCPNGVVCNEVIDALKTIYECDYKKARKFTDQMLVENADFYYDIQRKVDSELKGLSDPVMESGYKAEFNVENKISKEDAEELYALRDEALRRKAKKDAKNHKKESEPGEDE